MEARKELKIAATIHNQFGKPVTEARGSEGGGQQQKTQTATSKTTQTPPQKPTSQQTKTTRSQTEVFTYARKKTNVTIY